MIGLGTLVNTVAILLGGFLGVLLRKGVSEKLKNTLMQALGMSVLIIGISGALQGIYRTLETGRLDRQYIMMMIFSLVIGAIIGELIDIEDKLDRFGLWVQSKFMKSGGNFAQGFVTASLVYCVGAMAIVGSLEDGLKGEYSTLFAKSILDGVSAVVFSATMGIGVAFSAIPVLIYQGIITLLSRFIEPLMTDVVISQVSLVGSVLIMGIGINLLEIKKIKVGNLLPSIFIPFLYYIICLYV